MRWSAGSRRAALMVARVHDCGRSTFRQLVLANERPVLPGLHEGICTWVKHAHASLGHATRLPGYHRFPHVQKEGHGAPGEVARERGGLDARLREHERDQVSIGTSLLVYLPMIYAKSATVGGLGRYGDVGCWGGAVGALGVIFCFRPTMRTNSSRNNAPAPRP